MYINISYIYMCKLNRMKRGTREMEVVGDGVCDCSLGELLNNKKPFRPVYIFKHVLKNNFVLFICFSHILFVCQCYCQQHNLAQFP